MLKLLSWLFQDKMWLFPILDIIKIHLQRWYTSKYTKFSATHYIFLFRTIHNLVIPRGTHWSWWQTVARFIRGQFCIEFVPWFYDNGNSSLRWRHNERGSVSNHQRLHCLVNCQFRRSSASLAFVWGIHQWPVNSPHKRPVTRKVFPFDDVIMCLVCSSS